MNERSRRQDFQQLGEMTRRRFLQVAAAAAFGGAYEILKGNFPAFAERESPVSFSQQFLPSRINGLNFPSWRRGEYQQGPARQSLLGASEVSPNLIGIKVTEYQDNFNSTDIGPTENTANTNDLRSIINLAHEQGYAVMLAPQINLSSDPEHWHGEIGANFSQEQWRRWFRSYQGMIGNYAALAQETSVDFFVVGNEYIETSKREDDWRETVLEVRNLYDGPLTYAAHFFEFGSIPWWDELDLLGLNPYYRLMDTDNPSLESLKTAWSNIIPTIEPTVARFGKNLVFPEIGYPSVKGASMEPWNYRLIGDPSVPIDINEQAICYQALYESFWPKPYWQGVCWWHWNTDPEINGLDNKEYSPRGKPAAEVIAYYSQVLFSLR